MAETMVSARVSAEMKDAAVRVLGEKGITVSQAINRLFDYVVKHRTLPFVDEAEEPREARMKEAALWLGGLSRAPEGNAFQHMTDDDIRLARLASREP